MIVRTSADYTEWRSAVFARDGFTCQVCHTAGRKLCVHHIIPFSKNAELVLVPDNGITLCWPCHRSIRSHEAAHEERFRAIVMAKKLIQDMR
jgi:5-methylcytosine-specific restriction endonuclease McrA